VTLAEQVRERKTYGTTLSDLIDTGQLAIGETLAARHKREDYVGVMAANGRVKITRSRRLTESLSRTASAITRSTSRTAGSSGRPLDLVAAHSRRSVTG
jgi:hypothetical protein